MTTNFFKKLSIATVSTAAISLSLLSANPAQANGFSDGYEVENWTFTNNNADGFVNTTNAPELISLTGGDNGSGYSGSSWYTMTSLADGLVSFDWSYTTNDGPSWDPFGYILNGVFTTLTSSSGGQNQSGSASFAVLAGDLFGFGVNTVDNIVGAATVTVSNFEAPQSVPEPGTIAALGLIGLGGLLTKKKLNASDN